MEDKLFERKQPDLDIPNSDSVNPAKPLLTNSYKNMMEPKKLERIKYFTNTLMELRDQGFSEKEVIRCANIIAAVEKRMVWHKALSTYI